MRRAGDNIWKRKLMVVVWSVAGGLLMPLFTCSTCLYSFKLYSTIALFTSVTWVTMWLGNEYVSEILDRKISWTLEPVKRLIAGVVGMLIYTVPMMWLLVKVFEAFLNFSLGNISFILYSAVFISLVISLFLTGRAFLINWKQSVIDSEKLKRESITARYENLKSQVNPHFLFNSLNALSNLVHEHPDKAVTFIKQLSDVYRYVLDTRDREVVSLDEELKFLKSYIYLQQIRFGDKLKIELTLNGIESSVAPLSLQMLLENAIKHNIVSVEDPLLVRIYQEGDYLVVENDLQRKDQVQDRSGLGLENIQKRYEFLTDKPVVIREEEKKFIVKIPVIKPYMAQ